MPRFSVNCHFSGSKKSPLFTFIFKVMKLWQNYHVNLHWSYIKLQNLISGWSRSLLDEAVTCKNRHWWKFELIGIKSPESDTVQITLSSLAKFSYNWLYLNGKIVINDYCFGSRAWWDRGWREDPPDKIIKKFGAYVRGTMSVHYLLVFDRLV